MSALSLPIVVVLGTLAAIAVALFVAFKMIGLFFWLVGGALVFAFQTARDALRLAVGVVTVFFTLPRILASVILGRWSAAQHHGDTLETGILRCFRLVYQLALGNLIEVFISRPRKEAAAAALAMAEEDLEGSSAPRSHGVGARTRKVARKEHKRAEKERKRIQAEAKRPAALAKQKMKPSLHTPGPDNPGRGNGFDGYKVVGSLPSGGSGAKLYVADPSPDKRAALSKNGAKISEQVVIKCFTLDEGSNLSQIVRESRALESAKRLGMVFEHGLDERRYYYVMPYVAGDNLSRVSERMHAIAGPSGLSTKQVKQVMSFVGDVLASLQHFHEGGLWHKDIKPDNIIIRNGRAHLVDLGLVTPLGSAMTLTTHGTEYFRDPELVRQALKGAKVQDVDGARFDLYGTGAVLYALIEDSFPAHGSLSSVSKDCPDAVKWVIRRAMADLNSRYLDAREMLADVRSIQASADPFAMKPANLPSMGGVVAAPGLLAPPPVPDTEAPAGPQPIPAKDLSGLNAPGPVYRPGPITSAYAADSSDKMPPPVPSSARSHALVAARQARMAARSARQAARQARRKAAVHFKAHKQSLSESRIQILKKHPKHKAYASNPNRGIALGLGLIALLAFVAIFSITEVRKQHEMELFADARAVNQEIISRVKEERKNGTITRPTPPIEHRVIYGKTSSTPTPPVKATPPPKIDLPKFRSVHRETSPIRSGNVMTMVHEASGEPSKFSIDRGNGFVLVLDEFSRHSANDAKDMAGLLDSLRKKDFALLGVFDDSESSSATSEVELSAQARRSLGLYGPSESGAREQMLAFLKTHPEIDSVLWCGKVGEELMDSAFLFSQGDFKDKVIFEILQGKGK